MSEQREVRIVPKRIYTCPSCGSEFSGRYRHKAWIEDPPFVRHLWCKGWKEERSEGVSKVEEYQELLDSELIRKANDSVSAIKVYFWMRTSEGRASLRAEGRRPASITEVESQILEDLEEARAALIILRRRSMQEIEV